MRERLSRHPRLRVFSGMIAALFAAAMVWGQGLNSTGEIPVKKIVSWCAWAVVFAECWYLLFALLCRIRDGKMAFEVKAAGGSGSENRTKNVSLPMVWFSFLLCWMPSLLAVYPGFFLYDAHDEYMQAAQGLYSTHHPLLHVLLLGKTVRAVYELTGSYNYGITLYVIVQMMITSACFTYALYLMRKKGLGKQYRRIVFAYFAFFPNIVMFVLCTTKDILFAAMLFVSVLLIKEWLGGRDRSYREVKFFVPLVGFQTAALMLRNNVVYAFAAYMLILLIVKKGKRVQAMTVCAAVLGCYLLGSALLASALHAASGGKQEILTVPIQQISRAYRADRDLLPPGEKEILFAYLPESAIERYTPKLSDPVKIHFNNAQYKQDRASFWKLWAKLFAHNPVGYVNAWMMTSYGYWYPDADVDVYRGSTVFTHSYENSSYFGFETEEPGERDSKLQFLEQFYRELSLDDTAQKIPGVSWMFSMGTIFWIYVVCACVLVAKKQYGRLVPFAFPAMVWLTLLLGPTYLPRYVAFMWYILPLMVTEAVMPYQAGDKQ